MVHIGAQRLQLRPYHPLDFQLARLRPARRCAPLLAISLQAIMGLSKQTMWREGKHLPHPLRDGGFPLARGGQLLSARCTSDGKQARAASDVLRDTEDALGAPLSKLRDIEEFARSQIDRLGIKGA